MKRTRETIAWSTSSAKPVSFTDTSKRNENASAGRQPPPTKRRSRKSVSRNPVHSSAVLGRHASFRVTFLRRLLTLEWPPVSGVGAVRPIPSAILPAAVASPHRTAHVGVRIAGRVLEQQGCSPTPLPVAASDRVAVRPPVVRHVPHVLGRCSVEVTSASEPF
jgi:hypothetical protein